MKIKYNNYTYFVDDGNNKEVDATKSVGDFSKYEYDEDHFNYLVDNRRFDEAVAYASKYMPNDVEEQEDYLLGLDMLKKEGYRSKAVYSKISGTPAEDMVAFYDNVFKPGGTNNITGNKYIDKFREIKANLSKWTNQIGSLATGAKNNDADTFSIEFQPTKKTLFGIDWLNPDNRETIENFYEATGYNAAYLREHGVTVSPHDGKTELIFDKNSPMSNQLLYDIVEFQRSNRDGRLFKPIGNTEPQIKLLQKDANNPAKYNEITKQNSYEYLYDFWKHIHDAKDAKDAVENSFEKELVYSSIISPYSNDAIRELQAIKRAAGDQMSTAEFNRRYKELGGDAILDLLAQSGTADQEIWSNYNNKEWTDETIEPLEQIDKSKVIQLIGANRDRIDEAGMFMNGMYGTLITIHGIAKNKDKLGLDNDAEAELQDNRLQIFFPGIGQERAQEAIQKNTSTRAAQELNDMTNYEYDYQLYDGSELMYAGRDSNNDPRFIHKTINKEIEDINKEDAYKLMNESMILETSTRSLKFAFMNKKGDFVAEDLYDNKAKQIALKGADELFPGIPIVDFNGRIYDLRNPKDVEDIFNHKIDEDNIHFDVYNKLQKIYYLYDRIMAAKPKR